MIEKHLKRRMTSGKVYATGRHLPVNPSTKIVYLLISVDDQSLQRFLLSGIPRRGRLRTAMADRYLSLEEPGRREKNPYYHRVLGLKKDRLIRRIVGSEKNVDKIDGNVVVDYAPLLKMNQEALSGRSAGAKYDLTLRNLLAQYPAFGGSDVPVVLLVSPRDKPGKSLTERFASTAMLKTAYDRVLYRMWHDVEEHGRTDIAPFLPTVFLVSPDFTRWARLDITDSRTNTLPKLSAAVSRIEDDFAAARASHDFVETDVASEAVESAARRIGVEPSKVKGSDVDTLERMQDVAEKIVANEEESGEETAEIRKNLIDKILGDGEFASETAVLAQPEGIAAGLERERRTNLLGQQARASVVDYTGRKRTFEEIASSHRDAPSGTDTIPGEFVEPTMKEAKFSALSGEYYKSGMADRDLVRVLKSLNDSPDAPFFVTNVERKDRSDSLSCKEELDITIKGLKSRTIHLRVEMPKMTKDGYLYLNGSKRILTKQIIALPVIKVKPDQVLISTPYNKCILSRFGRSLSMDSSRMKSMLKEMDVEGVSVVRGAIPSQKGAALSLEHEDLGRDVLEIRIKDDKKRETVIDLSTQRIEERLEEMRAQWVDKVLDSSGKSYPIGYRTGPSGSGIEAVHMGSPSGSVHTMEARGGRKDEGRLDDFIKSSMEDAGIQVPDDVSTSTSKYAFTRVKALGQQIPLVVFLGYRRGLIPLLEQAGASPEWITQDQLRKRLKERRSDFIRFSDGILLINTESTAISLLVNGMKMMETREYVIGDTAPEGGFWLDYLREYTRFSNMRIAGLDIFRGSFIDPMTMDILTDLDIPTDFDGLFLYANTLLETNEHQRSNDLDSYRIRGPEMLNAILYKIIHSEMESLSRKRDTVGTHRLNIPFDEVLRQVQQAANVEEISELNPLLEAELLGKVTWIGPVGGLGDARFLNKEMRSYDRSFTGVFGMYSPDSQKIGVNRTLSYRTGVDTVRGMRRYARGDPSPAEMLTISELMSPYTSRYADPPRVGMQSKQAAHMMPIHSHTPNLVGSGAERALAHVIGNTFAYKARGGGVVDGIDEESDLVRLKYDDGSIGFIDMQSRSVKNSGGGQHTEAA